MLELDAVIDLLGLEEIVLVAHDASGPLRLTGHLISLSGLRGWCCSTVTAAKCLRSAPQRLERALEKCLETRPDLVLIDIKVEHENKGLEAARFTCGTRDSRGLFD
jgi:CheY-like chemotaxis protein